MIPAKHPKLAHLSDEHLEALVARYYAGSRTSDLVTEFGIDARPSDLFKLFSPREVATATCPYCEVNLWQKLPSKSSRYADPPYCPRCRHQDPQGTRHQCQCANCRGRAEERRQAVEDMKRALVREAYPAVELWQNPNVASLAQQLTLRDAVFMTALFRNWHCDKSGAAGTPVSKERPLAPTFDLAKGLLAHLAARGLISVSAESPTEAFDFDDELTRVAAHYIFKVRYRLFPMLPVDLIPEALRTIDTMANEGFWLPSAETVVNEAVALWKELALHECLETFQHQGELHSLQTPLGDKTSLTFQSLLEDFSVAQVYNIVWSAARNAAAYYQRGGITKSQAANSMVGGCRTRGDKARVEGWEVKPYSRNFDRPRSELSLVLHDVFLKIGELGFTHKPSKDLL
jgi:hypothetical protein